MPQLDFSTYASQIFWLFLTFSLLYVLMSRFALPQVRNVLETRQSRIADDIAKAEARKQEAELAHADFASALHEAKLEAHEILKNSYAQIAEKARQAHAALDARFEKEEQASEARYENLRAEATAQMANVSAETAGHLLKKLIQVSVDLPTIKKISSQIS